MGQKSFGSCRVVWNVIGNLYALCWMALLSVTLSDLYLPQTTPFSIFFVTFYIFVVDGDSDGTYLVLL